MGSGARSAARRRGETRAQAQALIGAFGTNLPCPGPEAPSKPPHRPGAEVSGEEKRSESRKSDRCPARNRSTSQARLAAIANPIASIDLLKRPMLRGSGLLRRGANLPQPRFYHRRPAKPSLEG